MLSAEDYILAGISLGGPQALLPDVGTTTQEVHRGLDRGHLVPDSIVVLSSVDASRLPFVFGNHHCIPPSLLVLLRLTICFFLHHRRLFYKVARACKLCHRTLYWLDAGWFWLGWGFVSCLSLLVGADTLLLLLVLLFFELFDDLIGSHLRLLGLLHLHDFLGSHPVDLA